MNYEAIKVQQCLEDNDSSVDDGEDEHISNEAIESAKSLCHTIDDVPDNVLKAQHTVFLKKLLNTYNGIYLTLLPC